MNRVVWIFSLFGLLFLFSPIAHAQVRPQKAPGALIIADQYFREGAFDKALIEYQKAFEADYNPAIYYNIAQCLHRMEHFQKAILYYELFISKNLSSPLIPHVQNHIAECEKKLQEAQKIQEAHTRTAPGLRKVAVVSEPVGAEVYVDSFTGTPVGMTPVMLELDTTPHLIVLKKAGFKDISQLVDVGVPGMTLLRFVLEDVNRKAPVVSSSIEAPGVIPEDGHPPATVTPDITKQWWFWTGLAVTSVFTISGVMTGLRTLDLQSQFEDTGSVSVKDRGERYRTWTDILIGGALITGVATGVAILLFPWTSRRTSSPATQNLSLLPSCGPSGCGFALSFTF
ncbi:PEGA domain-containing protein [Myxococcota bacterium]|nr:PEGA domain-containing protein [Myxococcota bacterium]MBU1509308.1 PEGA domain-containing protein [Myxococcota bacterium]